MRTSIGIKKGQYVAVSVRGMTIAQRVFGTLYEVTTVGILLSDWHCNVEQENGRISHRTSGYKRFLPFASIIAVDPD